jgi:hypothetical protein
MDLAAEASTASSPEFAFSARAAVMLTTWPPYCVAISGHGEQIGGVQAKVELGLLGEPGAGGQHSSGPPAR